MDNKFILVTAALIIIIITSIIVYIITINPLQHPFQSPTILEECKTFSFTNDNSINMLFFSDKSTVEKYTGFFLSTSPFDKNKESFNFYYIDTYTPKCKIYKNKAILCYSKELIKKAASCPNDFIFIPKNTERNLRSSTKANVVTLNTQHPLTVLTHEIGHVLTNLADEYIPASLPKSAKNCVQNCEEFADKTDGCFQGCSDADHYRSINNGIMRTLNNNNYGIFNEKLIKIQISQFLDKSLITGFALTDEQKDCDEQSYYLVETHLENETIIIDKKTIEKGCAPDKTPELNLKYTFTDAPPNNQENQIDGQTFIATEDDKSFIAIPNTEQETIIITETNTQQTTKINLQEDIENRPCKIN